MTITEQVSIFLGVISVLLGILSLWFVYFFSNKRRVNKYIKLLFKYFYLKKKDDLFKKQMKTFWKNYTIIPGVEEKGIENDVILIPIIQLSDKNLNKGKFRLKFKFNFRAGYDYGIKWLEIENEYETYKDPFTMYNPLDKPEISKQALLSMKQLIIEYKITVKIRKKLKLR